MGVCEAYPETNSGPGGDEQGALDGWNGTGEGANGGQAGGNFMGPCGKSSEKRGCFFFRLGPATLELLLLSMPTKTPGTTPWEGGRGAHSLAGLQVARGVFSGLPHAG